MTLCWRSQSFSVVSSSGLEMESPALLTTRSSPPNASTASWMAAAIWASSVTSACTPMATSGPPSSAATARAFSRFRSAMTTQAPSAARRVAMALPIPEAAPVTSAMRVAWDLGLGRRASLASSRDQYSIRNFSDSSIGA
ncbi:hypothetical protein D9M72_498100 [compost metagenome]